MIDDDWVNAGLAEAVAESVAKAGAGRGPAPPPTAAAPPAPVNVSPTPAPNSPTKGPKSLSTLGINVRGGVIRNKSTKITTQEVSNPVSNPRPSRDQRVTSAKTVPPPDPLSELAATNPALAAPSMFTTMDIDVSKKTQPKPPVASPQARQGPAPAPPMPEFRPNMNTTIRQLLEQANLQPDKIFHVVSDGRFMIKTELFTQASTTPG